MKPITAYVPQCRDLSLEEFCEAHPHPFLLHSASSGPLKPVDNPSRMTLDRLVLEDVQPLPDDKFGTTEAYDVFELRSRRDSPRVSIGCAFESDVRIDDQSVSKRHALILDRDEGFAVTDDDSSAGTQVNGELVSPGVWHALAANDRLTLGFVELQFLPGAEFYVFTKVLFSL